MFSSIYIMIINISPVGMRENVSSVVSSITSCLPNGSTSISTIFLYLKTFYLPYLKMSFKIYPKLPTAAEDSSVQDKFNTNAINSQLHELLQLKDKFNTKYEKYNKVIE